ncbi:unnamed protein product [Trichogramma brassicae]|uniref:Uncharacterized protein n=1 Tax=Trichogramma brassicae TaxID=86971 RepID=A0A6H5I7L1_9HYME|nr:unnamed protein product [Trichogramma brassicae]
MDVVYPVESHDACGVQNPIRWRCENPQRRAPRANSTHSKRKKSSNAALT